MKKICLILGLVLLIFGMIIFFRNDSIDISSIQKYDKEASTLIECKDVNDFYMDIALYKNKKDEYCLMGLKNNAFIFGAPSRKDASINMYEEYANGKGTYIVYGNDKSVARIEYKVNGKDQHIIPEKKDYVFEVIVIDGNKKIEDLKVLSASDEVLFTYNSVDEFL